ncbi:MAG: hypothetical protein WDO74_02060 [Pseudomonadota bacterium]
MCFDQRQRAHVLVALGGREARLEQRVLTNERRRAGIELTEFGAGLCPQAARERAIRGAGLLRGDVRGREFLDEMRFFELRLELVQVGQCDLRLAGANRGCRMCQPNHEAIAARAGGFVPHQPWQLRLVQRERSGVLTSG